MERGDGREGIETMNMGIGEEMLVVVESEGGRGADLLIVSAIDTEGTTETLNGGGTDMFSCFSCGTVRLGVCIAWRFSVR